MQICSRCNSSVSDSVSECPKCMANLKEWSITSVSLKNLIANPRVNAINLATSDDACPACQIIQGTYAKDTVPMLPVEGCSCTNGCRCFYQPLLEEIYP